MNPRGRNSLLRTWLLGIACALLLAACATQRETIPPPKEPLVVGDRDKGREVVMYAFNLIGVGYRFGGKNPDAGLDCSGMVAYLYQQVTGMRLPHNAAAIARLARPIARDALQEGDLVFFNTRNKPYSHVGIYVGEDRFVHAPSRNGKIELANLSDRYFGKRFESARTLLRN